MSHESTHIIDVDYHQPKTFSHCLLIKKVLKGAWTHTHSEKKEVGYSTWRETNYDLNTYYEYITIII